MDKRRQLPPPPPTHLLFQPTSNPPNHHAQTQNNTTTTNNSVLCAVYSHFGPGKFPDNWASVAACVALYAALNAVLAAFSYVRERDSFMQTLPKLGREHGVRVSSHLERCGEAASEGPVYTLVIANADKYEDREVKFEALARRYFHSDGYLAEQKFRGHVQKLLDQYERIDRAHEGSRPKALNPKKQS